MENEGMALSFTLRFLFVLRLVLSECLSFEGPSVDFLVVVLLKSLFFNGIFGDFVGRGDR